MVVGGHPLSPAHSPQCQPPSHQLHPPPPPSARISPCGTISFNHSVPLPLVLATMSVVVTCAASDKFTCFCKGSAERLKSLCDPATVPPDFDAVCDAYVRCAILYLAMPMF